MIDVPDQVQPGTLCEISVLKFLIRINQRVTSVNLLRSGVLQNVPRQNSYKVGMSKVEHIFQYWTRCAVVARADISGYKQVFRSQRSGVAQVSLSDNGCVAE